MCSCMYNIYMRSCIRIHRYPTHTDVKVPRQCPKHCSGTEADKAQSLAPDPMVQCALLFTVCELQPLLRSEVPSSLLNARMIMEPLWRILGDKILSFLFLSVKFSLFSFVKLFVPHDWHQTALWLFPVSLQDFPSFTHLLLSTHASLFYHLWPFAAPPFQATWSLPLIQLRSSGSFSWSFSPVPLLVGRHPEGLSAQKKSPG